MTHTVWTFGYVGRKPKELAEFLEQHKAKLYDVRFNPYSPAPQWQRRALERAFPDQYFHLGAFGNKNYKNGLAIELVNYEAGRLAIDASPVPVVLMCACKDYATCHRAHIADKLRADGFEVNEVPPVFLQTDFLDALKG